MQEVVADCLQRLAPEGLKRDQFGDDYEDAVVIATAALRIAERREKRLSVKWVEVSPGRQKLVPGDPDTQDAAEGAARVEDMIAAKKAPRGEVWDRGSTVMALGQEFPGSRGDFKAYLKANGLVETDPKDGMQDRRTGTIDRKQIMRDAVKSALEDVKRMDDQRAAPPVVEEPPAGEFEPEERGGHEANVGKTVKAVHAAETRHHEPTMSADDVYAEAKRRIMARAGAA